MRFNFGTKLKFKRDYVLNYITFNKGDIVTVAFHDHKYGIELVHPQIRGTFEFTYSPENAKQKTDEYFEVVNDFGLNDMVADLLEVAQKNDITSQIKVIVDSGNKLIALANNENMNKEK